MDVPVGTSPQTQLVDSTQRVAALADARQEASQNALRSADAAEERRANQREAFRAIISNVLGANTRLSIDRNDRIDSFVYRSIDRTTGEVIQEWPPVQFARFLEGQGLSGVTPDVLAGLVLDEQA